MDVPGNFLTTAMGILPHDDLDAALKLALSVDIPFWPQLPRLSFHEDMYVQVSEGFPGIRLDESERRLWLDRRAFYEELETYGAQSESDDYFRLSPAYAASYHAFLQRNLTEYPAIRGQSIGPISFGLKVTDEERRPIIYDDDLRELLFDFIARKVNVQYRELRARNPRAFVWVDEPGLEMLFASYTGYTGDRARTDFAAFLERLEGPRGVHLCGNPDWSFLLGQELDVLSLDAFTNGVIFTRYAPEVRAFLDRGGIICWGIVPTLYEEFTGETVATLIERVAGFFGYLTRRGIPKELLVARAWLAPARCCLVNPDGHLTVEKAFGLLAEVAAGLRRRYGMD